MGEKDFSGIDAGRMYNAIQEATAEPAQEVQEAQEAKRQYKPRREYTEQEKQQYMQQGKTTGRKGLKMPRINLAFAPDIYEYIQIMSRVTGQSMTDYVNTILRQYMEDHQDIYKKAVEFRNSL